MISIRSSKGHERVDVALRRGAAQGWKRGAARRVTEPLASVSHSRRAAIRATCPASVVRYCCFGLRGLSGMVISTRPAPRSGARTPSRNLVLFVRPDAAINSGSVLDSTANSSTWTWSRLRPSLVPAWSLLRAPATTSALNVTVTAPASSTNSESGTRYARQASMTRFVPRPHASIAPVR